MSNLVLLQITQKIHSSVKKKKRKTYTSSHPSVRTTLHIVMSVFSSEDMGSATDTQRNSGINKADI